MGCYFNVFRYDPQTGAVGMGIFLGLPLGITLASFAAIKMKVGEMPANASFPLKTFCKTG